MAADGVTIDEATVIKLLNLHGAYVDGKIREAEALAEASRVEAERAQAVKDKAPEDAV